MSTTRRTFLVGAAAGFGLLATSGTAVAAPSGLSKESAATIAQAFLNSRIAILGQGSRILGAVKDLGTKRAVQAEAVASDKMLVRRETLSKYGLGFTGSSVAVDAAKSSLATISATEAILSASCETRLVFAEGQGSPEFTADQVTRRIYFVKSSNEWKVDRVEEVTGLNSGWLDPIPVTVQQMDYARNAYPVERQPKMPDVQVNSFSSANSYATTWWNSRNGAYKEFSNDCQNFVSQIMRAGGWSTTNNWYNYWTNNTWYWTSIWSVVNNHFPAFNGSRYNSVGMNSTSAGDAMVLKAPNSTSLTHSMFIQSVQSGPSGGERYLAGHSINRLNHPFSQVVAANPGATFYGYSNVIF